MMSLHTNVGRWALLAASFFSVLPTARAQSIRGNVVDASDNHAIRAAFVVLLDANSNRLSAVLTNERGEFVVKRSPGARKIRVELIGYTTNLTELDNLPGSVDTIRLRREPVQLAEIEVRAPGFCGAPTSESKYVVTLWNAIRNELYLTDWSASEGGMSFVISQYRRRKGQWPYVQSNSEEQIDTVSRLEPFRSESLTQLMNYGLMTKTTTTYTFWAPSISILLSDWFVNNHCYTVIQKKGFVGLSFKPKSHEKKDVTGVIWLTVHPQPELRQITFEFVGGETGKFIPLMTGSEEFSRLASGHMIISKWQLEGTTIIRDYVPRQAKILGLPTITFVDESGGSVLSTLSKDNAVASALLRDTVASVVQRDDRSICGKVAYLASTVGSTTSPQVQPRNAPTEVDTIKEAIRLHQRFLQTGADSYRSAAVGVMRSQPDSLQDCTAFKYLLGRILVETPRNYTSTTLVHGIAGSDDARNAEGLRYLITVIDNDSLASLAIPVVTSGRRSFSKAIQDEIYLHVRNATKRGSLSANALAAALEFGLIEDDTATVLAIVNGLHGETSPLLDYLVAVARLMFNRGAAPEWLDAASADNADVRTKVRADIGYLMSDEDALAFDHARAADVRSMLERFWGLRAAVAGVEVEDRIHEHYRRVFMARSRFARKFTIEGRQTRNDVLADTLAPYRDIDDRGLLLVRRGLPLHQIGLTGGEVNVSEPMENGIVLWVYSKDERFFLAGTPGFGFSFIPGVVSCDEDVMSVVARYEPHAWNIIKACRRAAHDEAEQRALKLNENAELAQMANLQRAAVAREDAAPRFQMPQDFIYDTYWFRDERAGYSQLVVLGAFHSEAATHDLHVLFTLGDTVSHSFRTVQSILAVPDGARSSGEWLRFQTGVSIAGGGGGFYRVGLRSADGLHGTIYGARISIPSFENKMAISDLVIARDDTMGNFVRHGHRLDVVPMQAIKPGAFGLYYELYNMEPGESYQTEITFVPQKDVLERFVSAFRGRRSLIIQFSGSADDETVSVLQKVTAALPSGSYRLSVITRAGGQTVQSRREIRVVD